MMRFRLMPWLMLVLSVLPVCQGRAAESGPRGLVHAEAGTLPIVLTVPHGGHEAIPGVAPRRGNPKLAGADLFNDQGDGGTDLLATMVAYELRRLTGQSAYLVIAKFERKYVDANRRLEAAIDSPAARAYYDAYHAAIRTFVDDVRRQHAAGLLLDIHGQIKAPDVLMRGTKNGTTIRRLMAQHGAAAMTGPDGLFGLLEAHGFAVFPSNDLPIGGSSENAGFSGGYTVAQYGSHAVDGIDAVQLEFGRTYRTKARIDRTATEAARAIAAFYAAYLRRGPGTPAAR